MIHFGLLTYTVGRPHSRDILFWRVPPSEWLILQLLDRKCESKLNIPFWPMTYTVAWGIMPNEIKLVSWSHRPRKISPPMAAACLLGPDLVTILVHRYTPLPLCANFIYGLSANLRYFLTPLPPLCGRHIWKPLIRNNYGRLGEKVEQFWNIIISMGWKWSSLN